MINGTKIDRIQYYRYPNISYSVRLMPIYAPFESTPRTFLSGFHKNSGNIGILKCKP